MRSRPVRLSVSFATTPKCDLSSGGATARTSLSGLGAMRVLKVATAAGPTFNSDNMRPPFTNANAIDGFVAYSVCRRDSLRPNSYTQQSARFYDLLSGKCIRVVFWLLRKAAAFLASRTSSLCHHVRYVFSLRAFKQMGRITASMIVAAMQYKQRVGVLSIVKKIRYSTGLEMKIFGITANSKITIPPRALSSAPRPTFRRIARIHLREKPQDIPLGKLRQRLTIVVCHLISIHDHLVRAVRTLSACGRPVPNYSGVGRR